jgi:hypothetical protein
MPHCRTAQLYALVIFCASFLSGTLALAYFLEIDGTTCVNDGTTEQCQGSVQLEPSGFFENGLTTVTGRYAHEGVASSRQSQTSKDLSQSFAAYAFATADLAKGMLSVLVDAHGPVRAEGRSRLRELIYLSGSTAADGIADGQYLIGAGMTAVGGEEAPSSLTFTVIPVDPEHGRSGPVYSQTKSLGGGSANVFYIIGTARALIVDATLHVGTIRNSNTDNAPAVATIFLVLPDGVTFRSESGVLLSQSELPEPGTSSCRACTTVSRPPRSDHPRQRTAAHPNQ